ncbi:MAG: TIGR04219 family outer membrane beta-barrel protein [Marinicella sp.]|nr:TIGR04219 family outer membrane beta-barrel protein [Xanthomonadales bacterium]
MKKACLVLLFTALLNNITTANADTILGIYAGYNYWQHDLADDVNTNSEDRSKSETGNVFYLALEHPVPFIPNVKLQQNDIKGRVNGILEGIGIDGNLTIINTTTSIDLSHTEAMLYYEILDNWINLDLGLAVKQFDGNAPFYNNGSNAGHGDLDSTIALLYGKGQVDLPFTGLSVYSSIETLSLGDDDVTDIELGLNYESKSGLGGVIGYRSLTTDWKQNSLRAEADTEGFFLGLNYHF